MFLFNKLTYRYIIFSHLLLLICFCADVYSLTNEVQPEKGPKKEIIIPILQNGIEIMKYEIKRDELVASQKLRIPGIRQLRIALKNDIIEKEKLLTNLKSVLLSTLPHVIEPIQKTIDQERKIVESNQILSRVRRNTRLIIIDSIPIKKDLLASFENALSGF